MKTNRRSITGGLVGLGLVGALLTGGVVAAQAATGDGTTPQPVSTSSPAVGIRQFGHMSGTMLGQNSPMTAVARYLGLNQTELQDRLMSGESLAAVAKSQGRSLPGLTDAMLAAQKANLGTNTTLTSDQKTAVVAQMKIRIDTMVNATHTPGEGMGMGMGMGIGMGVEPGAGMGMHADPGMGSGMGSGMTPTTR